jgi:hypothetical protein
MRKTNAERRTQNDERRKVPFLNSAFCVLRSEFLRASLRLTVVTAAVLVVALPLFATDTGKADGKLNLNGNRVAFTNAYAWTVEKHVLVLLTDKPLPAKSNPRTFAEAAPAGTQTLLIDFDAATSAAVTQIVIHHADGTFRIDKPEGASMEVNVDEDAISGSLGLTATTTSPAGAQVRIRVSFNAEYQE